MVNPEQSEENDKAWTVHVSVLQMVHHIVMCPPHPSLERHFGYPWLPTYVNVYSTPLINEPPVLKDWPGVLRVDCVSSEGHEDVAGNGVDSGCGIHVVVGV
jgi:hypothetical protein